MVTSARLNTLLVRVKSQYPTRWQLPDPAEIAKALTENGAVAMERLTNALNAGTVTFSTWQEAALEILRRAAPALIGAGLVSLGISALAGALRPTSEQALQRLTKDFESRVSALADGLALGRIDIDDWQDAMEAELRRFHLSAALLGGGSQNRPRAVEIAQRRAREQMGFLNRWSDQLRTGAFPVDAAARLRHRARMYSGAAKATFSESRFAGMGMPRLPAYPRDYKTDCAHNCDCDWHIEPLEGAGNWDCYWVLGDKLHCEQCPERSFVWNPLRIRDGLIQPYDATGLFRGGATPNPP